MTLFGEVVHVVVEGRVVRRCVKRVLSNKKIMDSFRLVVRRHQFPIRLFTLYFLQVSHEAAVPMQMGSINSDGQSGLLVKMNEKESFLVSAQKNAKRVLEVKAERDDLMLRLNDYDVSMENFEPKPSKQDITLKVMTTSEKHLERNL